MVNFAEALEDDRIAEWRDYYVNYSRLKGWIKECENNMSAEAAQNFFDELTLSIERIDAFYNAKEEDLLTRMNTELSSAGADRENTAASIDLDITKLDKFAKTNREALRKISKKFDKNCLAHQGGGTDSGRDTKGIIYNWGSAQEPLQERVVERFSNYNFGLSTDRLDKIRVGLTGWKKGQAKTTPLSMEDLEVPLLDAPKRQTSGVEFSSELQSSFLSRVKSKWRARYNCSTLYFAVMTILILGCWIKYARGKTAAEAPGGLDGDSYIVIWVTCITLTLLVWQWPSDHVMLTATLVLNILGLLNSVEAWGAFSNSVVLSVAALSVVGDVVSHTGIIDILFAKLLGDTTNLYVAMFKIFIPCAIGAASISNTAVMACCMPAVEDWCNKNNYHVALFFMPISYLMLVAGTFAVFSTSTNLVAQGLLVAHDLPPLATFELGPPACVNMVVTLFYLIFVTPVFLRRFMKEEKKANGDSSEVKDVKASTGGRSYFVRVRVQLRLATSKTIEESGLLDCLEAELVDAVERHGMVQECPPRTYPLNFDDILNARVTALGIEKLRSLPGFMLLSQDSSELYATMAPDTRELVEVILDESCPLAKHRLNKAKTFNHYAAAIIAVRFGTQTAGRARSDSDKGTPKIPSPGGPKAAPAQRLDGSEWLNHGDQIVIDAPAGFCEQNRDSAHFVMLRKLVAPSSTKDTFKAYLSGAILLVMLVFVALNILDLFVCALGAITLLVVSKCATPDSVKKAVRLNVVLTIVGAFGLGSAIGKHGVAEALANLLVSIFAPYGHTYILVAIWIVVVMLGVIFHGTAVVALMFPLCHHVAQQAGIPLHQMVAVLCYSVACQMLSPVSYNTNLMAYAACPEYRFSDFTKVGFPLVVILFCLSIPMSVTYWPEVAVVAVPTM